MKFSLALASLSLLPAVFGHGSMTTITVGGKSYTGPLPNGAQIDSVIRQINSIDPVKDLTSDDMSCGNGAANVTATQSVPVNPGDTIAVSWISGSPPTLWPHNEGPLTTYIASCNGDCSQFNSLDAKWVKIDEASMVSGNVVASTGWVQNATFHQGLSYSMKLPSDTPPGSYLLRHEIIALHNAQSQGGAEFYPACSQITVGGDNSTAAVINTDHAVSFPGAYSPTDPGILIDVYTPPYGQYQFPGPAVVTALTTGATAGNSTGGSSSGSSGSGSGGSSPATTTVASSLMPTTSSKPTTTQAPANNNSSSSSGTAGSSDDQGCSDDDSDDGSDDGSDDSTVTVTETIYVTATGSRMHRVHTHTATAIVTLNPDSGAAAAAVVTPTASATATPSAANSDAYPRRRSRIMARHHFASLH